jgi:hypothetical protein
VELKMARQSLACLFRVPLSLCASNVIPYPNPSRFFNDQSPGSAEVKADCNAPAANKHSNTRKKITTHQLVHWHA